MRYREKTDLLQKHTHSYEKKQKFKLMPIPTFLDKPTFEVKLEVQSVSVIKLQGKAL